MSGVGFISGTYEEASVLYYDGECSSITDSLPWLSVLMPDSRVYSLTPE